MSQPESEPTPRTYNITFAEDSTLPVHHVNALGIRGSSDEFFFTLGVVIPPDQTETEAVKEAGYLVAQPVVRFAISRDTMEKFLNLMADQYEQQTMIIQRLHRSSEETSEKEASRNE